MTKRTYFCHKAPVKRSCGCWEMMTSDSNVGMVYIVKGRECMVFGFIDKPNQGLFPLVKDQRERDDGFCYCKFIFFCDINDQTLHIPHAKMKALNC